MNKCSMWIALLLTALSNPLMACESGRFGMVSITAGQTVQVQVVNTNNSTKAACRLIVEFSDDAGNVIASAPVIDNVYADRNPPAGGAAVEAVDSNGTSVYQRRFDEAP